MKKLLAGLSFCLLAACASNPTNPQDPYESFNRSVYKFNRGLDKAVLKPVAQGYKAITPDPVEKGISNFFANLGEIGNIVNNLLQFKLLDASSDTGRFLINSTLGLGGLFDPATAMGLEASDEDFGQTLAVWGLDSGPYLMLPILGPTTLRGVAGLPADNYLNPIRYLEDESARLGLRGIHQIDRRAQLLDFEEQLESAIDEYSFVRDIYLQNRNFKVHDGDIPLDDEFEECDPEFEDCDF